MESASDPLLTAEDIAKTYTHETDPVQTLHQYRKAKRLRADNPDRSRASIAREVNRPPSAVRGWLVEDKRPVVVKAIDQAKERGLLPLYPDDRVFPAINNLVAWIFAGGSIIEETFVPTFSIDKVNHQPILAKALSTLDLDCELVRREEYDDGLDAGLEARAQPGPIIGRMLHALGAPRGKKTGQSYSLPEYLNTIHPHHQRAFARVYLLLRGARSNMKGRGLIINTRRTQTFKGELKEFFEAQTGHDLTLAESGKLYVLEEAVNALAGEYGDPKEGLLYRIAYGEEDSPVTEEAFINTYRGSYRNPWTVVQQYQAVKGRIETADNPESVSASDIAKEIGGPSPRYYHWINNDSKPYAVNGLELAHEKGLIGFDLESETMAALNKLVAWNLTAGNITESNMHPKFGFRSESHQAILDELFETLDMAYIKEQSGISFDKFLGESLPHAHPRDAGAVLGRVLGVLGAPVGSHSKGLLSLPAYLGSVSKELRSALARIVILNRFQEDTDEGVHLAVPHNSRILQTSLYTFFEELQSGKVTVSAKGLVLHQNLVDELFEGGTQEEEAAWDSLNS